MSNSVPEKTYAGLARRLAAYAVDALLLFVAVVLLLGSVPLFVIRQTVGFGWTQNGLLLWAYVCATAALPFWLYYALLESGRRQATVGMRLLGLRVEGVSGGRTGFGRALLRTVVKLVPFEVNHAVLFLPAPLMNEAEPGIRPGSIVVGALTVVYLVSVVLTRRRQSIHDFVAGTVVVRARPAGLGRRRTNARAAS